MFGRTLLCIYDGQPINLQKKTKTTYRNRALTYTDTEDEYSTQSEMMTKTKIHDPQFEKPQQNQTNDQ